MPFYFAWADKTETTFGPEHQVEDESVYALNVAHNESDFPSLEVDIRNPRVGLLGPTRKKWCWLSYDDGTDVVPMFFGRLVGVPQAMQEDVIRLTFVARPLDFDAQRSALAATLRVSPYYDSLWMSDQDNEDPDRVLEGYSGLWHIDRITHTVTMSDIIDPEDGTINFTADQVFYDSVDVSYSQSPLSRVEVRAAVNWTQSGAGVVDITQDIIKEFDDLTPVFTYTADGSERTAHGVVSVLAGENLVQEWPKPGETLGGGWEVGPGSTAAVIGGDPPDLVIAGGPQVWSAIQAWKSWPGSAVARHAIRKLFNGHPGFVVQVVDHSDPKWSSLNQIPGLYVHGDVEYMWFPIWRIAPTLTLTYSAARDRRENMAFSVTADVQPLLSDPGEEETMYLDVGQADVDTSIHDIRSPRFFQTTRGQQAFENLLYRARAILLGRARAVDIRFQIPFEMGLDLSCRKGATLVDPRLPGGIAAGKIKGYSLIADGEGELTCTIVIGCSVGKDGSVTAVEGDPTYVNTGYVDSGYQYMEGGVLVPTSGDIGYEDYSAAAIDNDTVDLANVGRNHILDIQIEGGLSQQQEEVESKQPYSLGADAVAAANIWATTVRVDMKPVAGGPFISNFAPTVLDLKVPRTLDLE
jgi:hypothetical protein